ncbi:MAG TPA: hypothetical protein PLL55_10935 [Candidatus Aminicenantes bacterium]|nr:hypothetical protein [Acidobacteriota bacterium]HOY99900.1 hypothetical protein [Candidatus Aminicenantes bacterium]
MNKSRWLDAGILAVLLFWGTIFLCAARLGDYNHLGSKCLM